MTIQTSGRIWKLGCNWGKGAPSFYQLIRDRKIVIGVARKRYQVGDLIIITEGFKVKAIAQILAGPTPVTSDTTLQQPFKELQVDYSPKVHYYKSEWYELLAGEVFEYKLQQGICKVNNSGVRAQVFALWRHEAGLSPGGEIPRDARILYAFLKEGKSHRKIQDELLGLTAPTRGGGFDAMKILHAYAIRGDKKGILARESFESEYAGARNQYRNALELLARHYPELSESGKNIILFGPPGTGKTYNSIDWAVKLAAPQKYREGEHATNKKTFDELRKTGQIEFITLHQNYSYEDFMVGIKPNLSEGNGTLSFKKHYGVFYEIARRARDNYLSTAADTQCGNFVLVADEINRANISKVFGELITLIEEDKRLGAANELKVTLPDGEKDFAVPPNLYIIGTMNTADKSIALVDIALRRRFRFVGYYPRYEALDDLAARSLLEKVNNAIYKEKKSADYLIGHAYFMQSRNIRAVLQNKVIPLLMEYFSGKTDMVSGIFSNTGWRVTYNSQSYAWDISETGNAATI